MKHGSNHKLIGLGSELIIKKKVYKTIVIIMVPIRYQIMQYLIGYILVGGWNYLRTHLSQAYIAFDGVLFFIIYLIYKKDDIFLHIFLYI